jgi:hypothetical protein
MTARTCLAACALVALSPARGLAQDRSLVDVEAGAGRSFSAEAPGLGTLTFGGTVWPSRGGWGLTVTRVGSFGAEWFDLPRTSGNVTFLGRTNLAYWRLGTRYRCQVRSDSTIVLGAGMVAGGSYVELARQQTPDGVRDRRGRIVWGAVSGEVYWDQRVGRWLSARAGMTLDLGPDISVWQPVAMAVVSFD